MKKIALILGLCVSMSAHAFEPYNDTSVLVLAGRDGSAAYLTFPELEAKIEEENHIQFMWCKYKAAIAVAVLSDRGKITREEILTELSTIKKNMKHFMWLEIERIIAEVHRYNSQGVFEMEQSQEHETALFTEEYQKCIVSGF